VVQAPVHSVGQDHPLATLIGRVVDRLLDVPVLEFDADGFDFDQERKLGVDLDREIAEGAADAVLACEFGVLVIAEEIAQDILHDRHRVRLGDVACLLLNQNVLKRLEL
jgi:hypothetical protein